MLILRALYATFALHAIAPAAHAQTLDELLAARRYQDAAASLRTAAPDEARTGVLRIFHDVYVTEYEQERFLEAARGFEAAKQVSGLEDSVRQMLDFWHGMALLGSARDPASSDEEAATRREEARALFLASGEYARRMGDTAANVERALALSGRAGN